MALPKNSWYMDFSSFKRSKSQGASQLIWIHVINQKLHVIQSHESLKQCKHQGFYNAWIQSLESDTTPLMISSFDTNFMISISYSYRCS